MTNIIDRDELDFALAQQGKEKRRGRGKKKEPVGGSGSSLLGSSSLGKLPAAAKDKPRPYARLTRSLINKPVDQLWDFVKEHVGEVERNELKAKMGPKVTKVQVANWIERRETLLYGRHPKSELPMPEGETDDAEQIDEAPQFPQSMTASRATADKGQRPAVTSPNDVTKKNKSQIAAKDYGTSTIQSPVDKKRRMREEPPDRQPPHKLQKRDPEANLDATSNGHATKINPPGKHDSDSTPTLPQTAQQTVPYIPSSSAVYNENDFMDTVGMNAHNLDKSTIVFKGQNADRVLTATNRSTQRLKYPVTLHEVSIPHGYVSPKRPDYVPFRKEGKHGPGGDFDNDLDRATGVGHDYNLEDAKLYEEYLAHRAVISKKYPMYPKLRAGEKVDPEIKAQHEDWEIWCLFVFQPKYPGRGGGQWVCGCAKLVEEDDDESEEE